MSGRQANSLSVGLVGEDGSLVPRDGDFYHLKLFECFRAAGIDIASCDDADVILMSIRGGDRFSFERHVLRSEFYRRYRHKIVAYCPIDLKYPRIPGIYPGVTRFWASVGWAKGGHYVASYIEPHAFNHERTSRDLLFSFVGSTRTSPVRKHIMELHDPRACLVDVDPGTDGRYWWQHEPEKVRDSRGRFKDVMERTKFALCPRGVDVSSIRLFEAMEAGCVPVIISDRLVLPEGPNWEAFSIRVPERDVSRIPAIVAENEARFEEMSRQAREAWEAWFSDAATVRSMACWGRDILQNLPPWRRWAIGFVNWLGTWVLPSNTRFPQRLYMALVTKAPRGLKDRAKRLLGRS